MPVLIRAIEKTDINNPDGPKKWYPTQVTAAQVDENQVAMDIAEETTLNPSEAMMALRQLRKVVLRHLLAGESVKLGDWGSFSISLTSAGGAATKAEVNANSIKKVNLKFRPSESFKADLQKATFTWVEKLADGRSSGSTSGTEPGTGEDDDDSGQGTFG